MLEIQPNPPGADKRPDNGYSSWLQLPDGDIFLVDYTNQLRDEGLSVKEAVLKALDTPLEEGLQFERMNFYLLFSTEDMKEGMKAFTDKRPPNFKGR